MINGGFGLVLDGTQEAEQKAKTMLSWDVSNGVSDPRAPPRQWPCPPPRKQSGGPAAPVSPLQPPPGFPSSSDGLFPAQPVSAGGPSGVARVPACACACGAGLQPSLWPRGPEGGSSTNARSGGDGGYLQMGVEWGGAWEPCARVRLGWPRRVEGRSPIRGGWSSSGRRCGSEGMAGGGGQWQEGSQRWGEGQGHRPGGPEDAGPGLGPLPGVGGRSSGRRMASVTSS